MSTIKLNELAESDLSLTDLIAKADANGLMTKTNVQKLSNLIGSVSTSGMKTAIESTSVAPTEDGLYPCTEKWYIHKLWRRGYRYYKPISIYICFQKVKQFLLKLLYL